MARRLIVRGDRISFRDFDTGQFWKLPPDVAIAHDPSKGRRCSVMFLHVTSWSPGLDGFSAASIDEAVDYYGEKAKLGTATLRLPVPPWTRVAVIDRIEYRRLGKLADRYHHDFAETVPVYEAKNAAWKMPLPGGCQLTEHGFVWP